MSPPHLEVEDKLTPKPLTKIKGLGAQLILQL